MDVQMPNLDGIEATREIRQRLGLGPTQLPILALTANVMAHEIESCLQAGMNGHIAKPIQTDDLVHQLLASAALHNVG
jgi:CheY-like chemotaxis protein